MSIHTMKSQKIENIGKKDNYRNYINIGTNRNVTQNTCIYYDYSYI